MIPASKIGDHVVFTLLARQDHNMISMKVTALLHTVSSVGLN